MTEMDGASTQGSGPLLDVRNVSVVFGGLRAVSDVSLSMMPGEFCGLIGPNGAGKTTLFDVISGLRKPNGGTISFAGRQLERMAVHQRARAGIGRTFQQVELFDDLTVLENLWVTHNCADKAQAGEIMEELGLAPFADNLCRELPSGTRRIVGVARALAGAPVLALLDEPGAGLSSQEVTVFAQSVAAVASKRKCALLVVDHDLHLIRSLCNRVYVLNTGQLLMSGTPEEVESDARVISAYIGS